MADTDGPASLQEGGSVTQLPTTTANIGDARTLLAELIVECDGAIEEGRRHVAAMRSRKRALESSLKALSDG